MASPCYALDAMPIIIGHAETYLNTIAYVYEHIIMQFDESSLRVIGIVRMLLL